MCANVQILQLIFSSCKRNCTFDSTLFISLKIFAGKKFQIIFAPDWHCLTLKNTFEVPLSKVIVDHQSVLGANRTLRWPLLARYSNTAIGPSLLLQFYGYIYDICVRTDHHLQQFTKKLQFFSCFFYEIGFSLVCLGIFLLSADKRSKDKDKMDERLNLS